ncbi:MULTISPECIES: hypothetical protein [Pseudomonas]|uniref:hypothetical protein n=1 Tax=Pseudomonas TaxID=286 RepID=UPI00059CCD04|nr:MULTISPECIES: hypothetical protein [Pseudomonas]MBL0795654.1 hypothetical protein [Pseudomonas sp. B7]MBX8625565.1 hypothetical protein [Pseudomonas glycinae]MBY9022077.1 hypothetical protein [Pseudomonas fluorescens]MBY9028070.1 hypothetical protein [Pseudomonas fluorescens]MBY9034372.1 hypothetical protein [Pseudomonas fluorescens]
MEIKAAAGIAALILGASILNAQAAQTKDAITSGSEPLTTVMGKKTVASGTTAMIGIMCSDGRIVFSKPRCN